MKLINCNYKLTVLAMLISIVLTLPGCKDRTPSIQIQDGRSYTTEQVRYVTKLEDITTKFLFNYYPIDSQALPLAEDRMAITDDLISLTDIVDMQDNEEEEVQEEIPEYFIHVVTSKDSLWVLASTYYGNPYLYTVIKDYNNLKSNIIVNGQELKIPTKELVMELEEAVNLQPVSSAINKPAVDSKNGMTYIGDYKITGYDPWCAHCCSTTNGITASGVEAVVGRTIAMKGYPFGTKVYIEGYGYYIVEDTGNFSKNVIDIACSGHEECYDITNTSGVAVYLVEGDE